MIYDIVLDNRDNNKKMLERISRIETDISDLKQYKAKLSGVCVTISTAIGLIPSVLKHLGI